MAATAAGPAGQARNGTLASGELVPLPLDAYTADNSQGNAIEEATNELISACMRAKGFTVPPPTRQQQALNRETATTQLAEPYGITSMSQAAAYGYSAPIPASLRNKHAHPIMTVGPGTFGPKESPAYYTALVGYPSGIPPAGYDTVKGCTGQAYNDLDGGPTPVDPHGLLGTLGAEAEQETEGSQRVVTALAAWSTCMAARGFSYQTPMQAAAAQWPATPSPLEISTAKTDVSCKARTQLPLIWQQAEAGYQRTLITQNFAELAQVKQATGAEIKRAERLLARNKG